ncbi:MAG TPA: LysR family transcriptional regulator [Burkholderiaceae bacterium]|nr:LysR family transcriptional regulator [Burkholderiaceae bacterium]
MDRFAAIEAFVRVVEAGSFVRAAERLQWSTSSLSRVLAELEEHLGARLLNRTTRRLSLTESGQAFYERSVQLLNDLDEAEALAGQTAAVPRGTIRLTCSYNVATHRLAPAIAAFVARYPEVRFDVTVAERIVDLVDEGFDLAIRIGRIGSEQLVARKLGETVLMVCAAPAYLRGRGAPATPEDLARHDTLTYAYAPSPRSWQLFDAAGVMHEVRAGGSLHANNGDMLIAAAVAGLGVVCEPDFLLEAELRTGRLVPALPGYVGRRADIWAVYPSRRHLSVKVRLFVDHVAAFFRPAARPPPRATRLSRGRRPGSAHRKPAR